MRKKTAVYFSRLFFPRCHSSKKVMYESFGFTENIFNTKPLNICQEDMNKFIGRVRDIKSFSVDISSSDNAIVVVTGHRGVGKTSFVNVMEYAVGFNKEFLRRYTKVNIPHLIPCYHKIQLEPDDTVKNILLKSLSSLLFSIKRFNEEKTPKSKLPKEIQNLIKWISEVSPFTTESGQLSIAGFGMGISRSKSYKSILETPANILQDKIVQVVSLAKKHFKVTGIFLNINNVDILTEKKICEIFNQLRDYLFDIKGLWSVVIGQPGLYSSLYQQAIRVAEIINGQETKLDPLSEEDVMAVLSIRRKIYSQKPGKSFTFPIEESFIREIYKNSDGEIRQVFKSCDDIVRSVFKENPNIRTIKADIGRPVLRSVLTDQLTLDNLKAKDREIIEMIFKKGSLRPKDYKELKLKSAVDFTNKAGRLLSKNFLKKEVKGNTANYKVAGIIHLAKYVGLDFKG